MLEGFGIGYEVFGPARAPSVLLMPTWQGVHSRIWKLQVPYLARRFNVITFDSPGNGRGQRTTDPAAYEYARISRQAAGLLDHLGTPRADLISVSRGSLSALDLAGHHPERIRRIVLINNLLAPDSPLANNPAHWERRDGYAGREKYNYYYCLEHFPEFLAWLAEDILEPHSTKAHEDFVAWGLETTAEVAALATFSPTRFVSLNAQELLARVRCPVLALQGDLAVWIRPGTLDQLAEVLPDCEHVLFEGGSLPNVRDPVRTNLEIVRFLEQPQPAPPSRRPTAPARSADDEGRPSGQAGRGGPLHAIEPRQSGQLTLEGFGIGYDVYGPAEAPSVLCLPTWQGVDSRVWKMQVPFLARSCQVITFDSPGNGRGQRTADPQAFQYDRIVRQAVGLLDHLGVAQADLLAISRGCGYALDLAGRYPERVRRVVLISSGLTPDYEFTRDPAHLERREVYEGWQKWNYHYCREHYRDFLEWLAAGDFVEPHSTKAREDFVAWGLDTTPEIVAVASYSPERFPGTPAQELFARVGRPVLVIYGERDQWLNPDCLRKVAEARPDWEYVLFEGSGHIPNARDPVRTNLAIEEFLSPPQPRTRVWRRAASRAQPRALFVSSPIGLGHAQRDLAIARELRRLVPGLQIDWLAQPPVTHVLEANGETIHPLSGLLSSESAHWEQSAGEHELHCFYAWREMDEILCANFMLFLEAARATPYDLWIGDEAWEVDYYLHENPELKTAPFVFLTDFLGWLPMDRSPGSREAALTADYNLEMLEQVARYKRVRDRSIFIGEYDDLVPERFGPGLPLIPDWAREHFAAVGYIAPFDPADYADTRAVRARLGYDPDRPLVMCAAGGTAVGRHLLRKCVDAWPLIHRARPEAQCVVIAGPRIDPNSLPAHEGLLIRPYVHNLYEHLAVTGLGLVQGGLGTTMELVLNRRPFLYFPLKNHCEQVYHVARRLERHGAGRRMDYAGTSPAALAEAALGELGADTSGYAQPRPGGAGRAASLIAELL
jgi:pimeloyl-ACP methyl ester carboxylesterase/UDP:flavonoid glycosyltransferase YjiC (YdhE family)